MLKKIIIVGLWGCFHSALAFKCYFTVVKDSCWTDYHVEVSAVETTNKKLLGTAVIPAKKSWSRISFPCNPGQQLEYQATFSPVFWENDKDRVFHSKQYHKLNDSIKPTDIAWNIEVCYPSDFAEIPLPPQGGEHCKCDFSAVKPIE